MKTEKKFWKFEPVSEVPESQSPSYTRELIEDFMKSGFAIAKVISVRPSQASALRLAIDKLHLADKVHITIRGKEVYLQKGKTKD